MLLNRNSLLLIIGIGLAFGLLITFSPGSMFFLVLFSLIILAMHSALPQEDRVFLIRLFMLGIIARIFLLLSLTFIYSLLDKWTYQPDQMRAIGLTGDGALYTVRSWWIVQYLTGEPINEKIFNAISNPYGHSGYLYIMALFYYLFGFSPVSVTLINCTASVLIGIVFYFMAKEIAGTKEARITAFLIVFFPSLIFWSVTNLKDTMFIFATTVIMWSFMKFVLTKKYRYLTIFIISAGLQYFIRKIFLIPTFLTAVFSYLVIRKKIKYIFILILILSPLLSVFDINLSALKRSSIAHHRGVFHEGGSTYKIFDDRVYNQNFNDFADVSNLDMAKAFLKGAFHFFLEPFPWRTTSVSSTLSLPQMAVWYLLLPFAVIGMFFQLRYNWKKSLFLLVYLFSTGSFLIMSGGNVGTDFRFRDILTPIIILFASIGICNTIYSKSKH